MCDKTIDACREIDRYMQRKRKRERKKGKKRERKERNNDIRLLLHGPDIQYVPYILKTQGTTLALEEGTLQGLWQTG
jgi:hypothetical protein